MRISFVEIDLDGKNALWDELVRRTAADDEPLRAAAPEECVHEQRPIAGSSGDLCRVGKSTCVALRVDLAIPSARLSNGTSIDPGFGLAQEP
jgi:hypothetical protein